jgi:preprotein translocase subunit YajC
LSGGFLIILILIFGLMYFLMIRPQRQQQRKHQEMLSNLSVGDEVITAGGIYGDVVGVEPDRISLEIAEDVEIEVARRSIATIVVPEDEEEIAEEEPEELEPVAEAERTEAERTDGSDTEAGRGDGSGDEPARAEPEEARR